jgi:hypothetical protein
MSTPATRTAAAARRPSPGRRMPSGRRLRTAATTATAASTASSGTTKRRWLRPGPAGEHHCPGDDEDHRDAKAESERLAPGRDDASSLRPSADPAADLEERAESGEPMPLTRTPAVRPTMTPARATRLDLGGRRSRVAARIDHAA